MLSLSNPPPTSPQLKLEEFLPSVVVVSLSPQKNSPFFSFFFYEVFDRDTFSSFNFGNEEVM